MKFLFHFALMAAAITVAAAEKCDIGGKLRPLASPVWLDGSTRSLKDIGDGKKFTVLYVWKTDQAALGDFSRIVPIAERFKSEVAFAGIAVGTADRVKRFPGASRLGFPVNIDSRGSIIEQVEMPDKLPIALVLDRQMTLLWSGRTPALPMILKECLDGKFDLKEEMRKNKFAHAVNSAVKAQNFERAFRLINSEWKKSYDSLELLNTQIALLTRKLNRPDVAFSILHDGQRKNPGDHRFFEAEYRLLGNPAHAKRLPGFFNRVKKEFAGKPGVLMAFAIAEMGRPAESLDMKLVISLAELGWRSKGFTKNIERGMFAIEYAKIAHAAGRTDAALKLTQIATECFKGDAKRLAGAKQAELYYRKLMEIAPSINIPDLKK